MSAFAYRRRTRLFAATTVALAALSLTACQGSQDTRDEGSATQPSSQPAQPKGAEPNAEAQGAKSRSSSAAGNTADAPGAKSHGSSAAGNTADDSGDSDPGAPENHVPCTGANTEVTAQLLKRPLNPMLLTVTNTGSKICDLFHYPAVQFGDGSEDAQSVPPVMKETKPQAVVSLAPGDSGYAGISLSAADGSGSNGYRAKTLKVHFSDADENGINPPANPTLPAKGVHVDDSIRVTYWQSDSQDALSW